MKIIISKNWKKLAWGNEPPFDPEEDVYDDSDYSADDYKDEEFFPGEKVRISGGSGVDSGKIVTVVSDDKIKTDGRGIPTNVEGAYQPVDWENEVPFQYPDGKLGLMFRERLTKVQQEPDNQNYHGVSDYDAETPLGHYLDDPAGGMEDYGKNKNKIIISKKYKKFAQVQNQTAKGIADAFKGLSGGLAQAGIDKATIYAQEVIGLINQGVNPQQAFDQIIKIKYQMGDKEAFKNKVIEIVKNLYSQQAAKPVAPVVPAQNPVQSSPVQVPVSTFGNQPNKNWAVPIR